MNFMHDLKLIKYQIDKILYYQITYHERGLSTDSSRVDSQHIHSPMHPFHWCSFLRAVIWIPRLARRRTLETEPLGPTSRKTLAGVGVSARRRWLKGETQVPPSLANGVGGQGGRGSKGVASPVGSKNAAFGWRSAGKPGSGNGELRSGDSGNRAAGKVKKQ